MESAPCMFLGKLAMLICYLDHLIVFAKFEHVIARIKPILRKRFTIKDLGKPKKISGSEII